MKLPMMLRTTTQRGLLSSASFRTVPSRSFAAALRTTRTLPQSKLTPSISSTLRLTDIPKRSFTSTRKVASPTAKYTASPLTDGEYHKLSNSVLDSLTETFETLLEEADVETLEQEARAKNQGATRGSPATEWDIECAVGTQISLFLTVRRMGRY